MKSQHSTCDVHSSEKSRGLRSVLNRLGVWNPELGISFVALVLICGCKSTPAQHSFSPPHPRAAQPAMSTLTNRLDPELLQPPTNFFTLGPGDKLDIDLIGETNSLENTTVGPDGKIYFYLLPGVEVWGMTLGQAKAAMQHELGNYFRSPPQVEITLRAVESRRVWLLGRFQQPGVYTLAGPTTVLEAISAAGGPQTYTGVQDVTSVGPLGEQTADLRRSFVVRHGQLLPVDFYRLLEKGDVSQNIYLQPDDFIYFPPAYTKEIYVLGAVTQSRAVPYTDGLSLLSAISSAYGTVRDAYLTHVTIVRGSLAQPEVAVVNYYDILKHRAPDVELQPHDIIYVPFSPYRYLRKYVEIAINTFASSVAINAGTHLVVPHATLGAGIFIPAGSGITVTPSPVPPIH